MVKRLVVLLVLSAAVVTCRGFSRRHYPPPPDNAPSSAPLAVVAYYPVWASCDMPPQKLDWGAFTHLIFFWGEPVLEPPYFSLTPGSCDSTIFETGGTCGNNGWCVNPLDDGKNGLTNQRILRDSAAANGVKLLLSVGGEVGNASKAFAAMIADTMKQDVFLETALGFARRHGYDGIDIDWEYPTRGAEGRALYNRFLRKLRAGLDGWQRRGLISMAVPTWYWWDRWASDPLIDTATVNACVDFVDLMEYGMQNSDQISHYSPLYASPQASGQETWNLRGVNEWKAAGVDSSRLVTLIPFEAVKMNDLSGDSPVAIGHAGGGSQWIGIRDVPPSAQRHWDDAARAVWAEEGSAFYSFEDSASIAAKVQYARDQHIGGVGIWELWRGWLPNARAGEQAPLLRHLKSAVGAGMRK